MRGIGEMTRCLPGRQGRRGRRSRGKAFRSEETAGGKAQRQVWRMGNSDYSGGIARVGTRGCGPRGRQRQADEGN